MSRHNQIPMRMKVEGMRLVPASSFDQEALATYQKGAVLQVYLWQGRNPDLLRKFWAIVGKVVETCKTPWEDKEEAADALKLALGITDVGSTVNGQMFVRPGSISFSAMDEARFRKFFEDSMALLSRITGVDVTELGQEAADTGPDHNPETGEIIEHESGERPIAGTADEPPHIPSSASTEEAAPSSSVDSIPDAPNGGPAPGKLAGGDVSSSPSSPARDPETETLIQFAKDVLTTAAADGSSLDAVKAIEKEYAAHIKALNASGISRARSISSSARAILEGSTGLESAVEFFSDALGCDPAEIGG
jgi:hypothetical protein